VSGLLRTLLLGDIGNWSHISDVENRAQILESHFKQNKKLDEEQSQSIIELELAFANLINLLLEKEMITGDEISAVISNAESDAKEAMKRYNSIINPSLNRNI
jgi:hypothetical protein